MGDCGLGETGRGRPFRAAAGTEPGLGLGWAWAGVAAHPHARGGGVGPRPGPAWSFPSGGAQSPGGRSASATCGPQPPPAGQSALGGVGLPCSLTGGLGRLAGLRPARHVTAAWFCSEVTADVCLRCHGNGLTSQSGRGTFPGWASPDLGVEIPQMRGHPESWTRVLSLLFPPSS